MSVFLDVVSKLNLEDKGHYYSGLCPFHSEANPSFVLYKNTGLFQCFSCKKSGRLSYLYKEAFKNNINPNYLLQLQEEEKNIKHEQLENKAGYILNLKGNILNIFEVSKAYSYLKSRGISNDFIESFDIKYASYLEIINSIIPKEKKVYKNRIMIPLYSNRKIVSYELRADSRNTIPKVLYPRKVNQDFLFNYEKLNKKKPLIVVEGIFDIPKIWTNYSKNVTCLFGSNLGNNQIKQLQEFNCIILFKDDDKAGDKLEQDIAKILTVDQEYYSTFVSGKDPGDSTIEEIVYALDNSNHLFSIKEGLHKYKDRFKVIVPEVGLFDSKLSLNYK